MENWQRESCFTRTTLLHTSLHVVAIATVRDSGFELVDHLPYSPILAPSDHFLFPPPPGGGGNSTFIWTGGGVPLGVENLTLLQTTLSQYTLQKLSYAYPVLVRTDSLFCCVSSYIHKNLLRPARAVAGARSRACHKLCGPARTVAGAEIAGLS